MENWGIYPTFWLYLCFSIEGTIRRRKTQSYGNLKIADTASVGTGPPPPVAARHVWRQKDEKHVFNQSFGKDLGRQGGEKGSSLAAAQSLWGGTRSVWFRCLHCSVLGVLEMHVCLSGFNPAGKETEQLQKSCMNPAALRKLFSFYLKNASIQTCICSFSMKCRCLCSHCLNKSYLVHARMRKPVKESRNWQGELFLFDRRFRKAPSSFGRCTVYL